MKKNSKIILYFSVLAINLLLFSIGWLFVANNETTPIKNSKGYYKVIEEDPRNGFYSFDMNSIILTRNLFQGENYWSEDQVKEYSDQSLRTTNYVSFIHDSLRNENIIDFSITKESLSDYYFSKYIQPERANNPNYPWVTIGDFNGDNLYPDIAFTVYKNGNSDYSSAQKIFVKHAGKTRLIEITEHYCGWISTYPMQLLDSYWEDHTINMAGDGIMDICPEKSGVIHYWNGAGYSKYVISD